MTAGQLHRKAIAGVIHPRGDGELCRARVSGALEAEGEGPVIVEVAGALAAGAWNARPARDADGRLCVLDGELHDRAELARQLGMPVSTGDEALLLAGWLRFGDTLPERLRGDYAVVLWDPRAGRGLAFCDHMGARGLWLTGKGGRLSFASDSRQLLRLLDRTPPPDSLTLAHWLSVTAPPADRTLFDGVDRLPAGHRLRLPIGNQSAERYWAPGDGPRLRCTAAEAADEIRARLEIAVERRLPADGPVGLMLSGGLDSSTVGGLAATLAADRLRPYSAVFPNHPAADESQLIEVLGRSFDVTGVQMSVRSGSVIAGALGYLDRWSLPPTSPNLFFWEPLLARARSDGVDVMLDGEGGDELFGTAAYLLADRLLRGRAFSATSLARRAVGRPDLTSRQVRRILVGVGVRGALPYGVHERLRRRRNRGSEGIDWLEPVLAKQHFVDDDPWRWKGDPGPRWLAYQRDIVAGVGSALAYEHVRRRANDAGLVARHPLIDPDVVDLLLRLEPALSFDYPGRPLLRQAIAGLVPDEVRLRPDKSSFNAPFHEALRGPDLTVLQLILGDPGLQLAPYVRQGRVSDIVQSPPDRFPGGLRSWAIYVWRMITAELWLRGLAGEDVSAAVGANTLRRSVYTFSPP